MKVFIHMITILSVCICPGLIAREDIFLSKAYRSQAEPLCFWGSEPVKLTVWSHQKLSKPSVYVLSKALSSPVQLEGESFDSSEPEANLYRHDIAFVCPEGRGPLRYMLRFERSGLVLLFDSYPLWMREQVGRKLDRYSIEIQPDHIKAAAFFGALSNADGSSSRPVLRIDHGNVDLLLQPEPDRFIWKTDIHKLDIQQPAQVLLIEVILDTINELNQ